MIGRKKWNFLLSLACFLIVIVIYTDALSGNVCYRRRFRIETRRRCRYRYWGNCCSYQYYRKCIYYQEPYCCRGWTVRPGTTSCTKPLCNPPCQNGGTCIKPQTCACRDGFDGRICGTEVCSATLGPCYPGVCGLTVGSCKCSKGFTNAGNCNRITSSQKPDLNNVVSSLSEIDRAADVILYTYITDATDDTIKDNTNFWSRELNFNTPNIYFEAVHMEKDLPPRPSYVQDFKVGIIEAYALVHLRKDSENKDLAPVRVPCKDSNFRRPVNEITCNETATTFYFRIEDTDVVRIQHVAVNGGYRTINGNRQQVFGQTHETSTFYGFDVRKPEHCNDACSADKVPLEIVGGQDIRKTLFEIRWKGWTDKHTNPAVSTSGMYRYAWEVFELQADRDGYLVEPRFPIFIQEVNVTNRPIATDPNTHTQSFNPPGVGMYSIILQASDRANNSEYVRRLVLFDPSPIVSINTAPGYELYIASANPFSEFMWQTNDTGEVNVTWTGHFENTIHKEKQLLNEVVKYPRHNPPKGDYKIVLPEYDDKEGKRTRQPINNVNGIVKFEIAHKTSSSFGSLPDQPDDRDWVDTGDLRQSQLIRDKFNSGDSLRVWVRATDIFGATNIDYTTISFDFSEPLIETPVYRNEKAPNLKFSSIIDVNTEDRESGSWAIRLDFVSSTTSNIINSSRTETRTTNSKDECDSSVNCYESRDGHFYFIPLAVPFNHCKIRVPKTNLSDGLRIEATAINRARLEKKSPIVLPIDRIDSLSGLETFHPPKNVTLQFVNSTSATINWSNDENCYRRSGIRYKYSFKNGTRTVEKNEELHGDKQEVVLNNLESDTNYTIILSTMYDADESERIVFEFKTSERVGKNTAIGMLSVVEIAGVGIGVFFLLGIIIILVVLVVVFRRRGSVRAIFRPVASVTNQESSLKTPVNSNVPRNDVAMLSISSNPSTNL